MKKIENIFLESKRYFRRISSALLHNQSVKMSTLETLRFDNRAIKRLPIDSEERNYVRTVNAACFSKVMPTPVANPRLVACSKSALSLLDLSPSELEMEELVECFSGNKVLPGSEPSAHCYCGHQFGYFSGQLGDGAAMYLGEVINSKNERWEIQLKGAGLTPYSRTADGRKVLRSTIREFLCSEAMHFLGVPTSRAGTCITSDTKVIRDIFYDGHPKAENCSIVLRIAPTFLRFGSFEIFKTLDPETGRVGPSVGRIEILHTLLAYAIETFYPEFKGSAGAAGFKKAIFYWIHEISKNPVEKYAAFFKEVVLRTARLVAHWQCVGFCHGVLNTDNMSILGLTLDYGPFGFLDVYDPNHICNASDEGGRYSFIKQPDICLWNLQKFAEAIRQALPLSVSVPLLNLYEEEFQATYLKKMRAKLGLIGAEYSKDNNLIEELFDTMEKTGADFTNTFLCLSFTDATDSSKLQSSLGVTKEEIIENCYSLEILLNTYKPNLNPAQLRTFKAIASSNPELIEQLGRQGLAIKRVLLHLQKAEELENLTEENKIENDHRLWNNWLTKYKVRVEKDCEAYGDAVLYNKERIDVMKNNNPRFILRNHIAQDAIEKAESGDYSQVMKLVDMLENPYDHSYSEVMDRYSAATADTANEGASAAPNTIESRCRNAYDRPPSTAFSIKVS